MVSVCLATFNGEKYIKEQLESILPQLSIDDEVIISDDNSTDKTCAIIDSFQDNRIRLYNVNFRQFKKNFVNALSYAKGEYIFLSDQDDIWMPNKVKRCMQLMRDYDLVVTDAIVVDESLNVINNSFFLLYGSGSGVPKNIFNNTYLGACMCFTRKILDLAMPFPKSIEITHDAWLGLVAEVSGKPVFAKEPLIQYRRHSNAVTNVSSPFLLRSKRSLFLKLKNRFITIYELAKFFLITKLK